MEYSELHITVEARVSMTKREEKDVEIKSIRRKEFGVNKKGRSSWSSILKLHAKRTALSRKYE